MGNYTRGSVHPKADLPLIYLHPTYFCNVWSYRFQNW